MANQTEVKLPESLEVVAYRYAPSRIWDDVVLTSDPSRARLAEEMRRPVAKLVLLSDAESALKARDAEIERLRGVVVETRRVLELENNKGVTSAIRDTLWRGPAETLFDYLDAALENGGANV